MWSLCVWGLKTGTKVRSTESVLSFELNTHKHYILRHCISIVFILQKKIA